MSLSYLNNQQEPSTQWQTGVTHVVVVAVVVIENGTVEVTVCGFPVIVEVFVRVVLISVSVDSVFVTTVIPGTTLVLSMEILGV